MLLGTVSVSAEEINFFRSEVLSTNLILHSPETIPPVQVEDATTPCNCEKVQEVQEIKEIKEVKTPYEPCEIKKPCPCDCQRNRNCNIQIIEMHKFLKEADCAVGLTPEQQISSEEIRKNAIREFAKTKHDIVIKKHELNMLQQSDLCETEIKKQTKALQADIENLNQNIAKIFKNTDKEFKSILNPEQKKVYKAFKKEWKQTHQPPCVFKKACPCAKPCPCGNADCGCKQPCYCGKCNESCDCNKEPADSAVDCE